MGRQRAVIDRAPPNSGTHRAATLTQASPQGMTIGVGQWGRLIPLCPTTTSLLSAANTHNTPYVCQYLHVCVFNHIGNIFVYQYTYACEFNHIGNIGVQYTLQYVYHTLHACIIHAICVFKRNNPIHQYMQQYVDIKDGYCALNPPQGG